MRLKACFISDDARILVLFSVLRNVDEKVAFPLFDFSCSEDTTTIDSLSTSKRNHLPVNEMATRLLQLERSDPCARKNDCRDYRH